MVSRLSPEHYICIHKGCNNYNVDHSDCFLQEYVSVWLIDNIDPANSKRVKIFQSFSPNHRRLVIFCSLVGDETFVEGLKTWCTEFSK